MKTLNPTWKFADPPTTKLGRVVDAVFVPDSEHGGYTVSIAQLPGVHSQGRSLPAGFRNIRAALRGVIESYEKDGDPIPWRKPPKKKPGEHWVRIAVKL